MEVNTVMSNYVCGSGVSDYMFGVGVNDYMFGVGVNVKRMMSDMQHSRNHSI